MRHFRMIGMGIVNRVIFPLTHIRSKRLAMIFFVGIVGSAIVLDKLQNPEEKLTFIHVAGTNGKGSTAAILAQILKHAGYKVGLYTSPHIMDFEERIMVNGKKIPRTHLLKLIKETKRHYSGQTFFEFTTALAFQHFKEQNVDVAVCEVGLGGRLDATNVIKPHVSVITTIHYDHQNYLGQDITAIAKEKAGIIKQKAPVVTLSNGLAYSTIKRIAKTRGSKLAVVDEQDIKKLKLKKIQLNLRGQHQFENAALALKTCELLDMDGFTVEKDAQRQGLETVSWPGRLEFIRPNVLIDAAHNPQGSYALSRELKKLKGNFKKIRAVMGTTRDKDAHEMVKPLNSVVDEFYFTTPTIKRAGDPKNLAAATSKPSKVIANPKVALNRALKETKRNELLVVCGSIYLLEHVYRTLRLNVGQ